MSRAFNLTAEINLRGPANIRTVVADIRRQLGSVDVNINPRISPAASRNIGRLNADLQNLNRTLTTTRATATDAATAIRDFSQALNSIGSNSSQNLNNATNACQNLGRAAGGAGGNIGGAATQMEEFGRQSALAVRRFAAFSIVTTGIYAFTNAISQGVSAFIDFDKEFVRLQQVTGESARGLASLGAEITRLSTDLGIASKDLTTVAVTLAQAGLSATETKTALEALALSALAPSFDDMNETVEGSIALMRQFGIGANGLESALGSINSVSAQFAVEASDIITAIQRTGGVFATASKGVTEGKDALNEFIAVFTSVRQTTRESAETIATGLRTIFTRIQRGGTIQALREYGVELTDLEGKFVGPYEAVRRLSEGLNQLDPRDIRFSNIVEQLGGFRQIGKVIPLIQQFAVAQQALKVAQTGQSSLANDAATAQLSVANQIAKVREEFTALIRSIGESDSFRSFVSISLQLASALIQVADSAKIVLPALTAIATVRGLSAAYQFGAGFTGAFGAAGGARGLGQRVGGGRRFASGGMVPGSGNRDTVPAMLTPGEFVIRKKAVETMGANRLHSINRYGSGGDIHKFAGGGPITTHLKTDKRVGAAILEQGQVDNSTRFSIPRQSLEESVGFRIDPKKLPNLKNIIGVKEGLSPDSYGSFDENLNKGIISGVNIAAGIIAKDLGIQYKNIAESSKQSFLNGINSGTRGNIFEDVLLALKESPGPFSTREAGQPFDFPSGISGVLKDDYKNLPSAWVDAKASFNAAFNSKSGSLKNKTLRQLSKEIISNKNQYENKNPVIIKSKKPGSGKIGLEEAKTRFEGKSIDDPLVIARLKEMGLTQYRPEGTTTEKFYSRDTEDIEKFLKTNNIPTRGTARGNVLKFLGQRGVKKAANGGTISGGDTVPALLTPGEFVINKKAASRIGNSRLHQLNRADKIQGYNSGGFVQKFARGGTPSGAGWTGRGVNPLSGNYGNFRGGGGMAGGGMGTYVALTAGGVVVDSLGDAIGEKAGAAIKSIGGDALNFTAIGSQLGMMLIPVLGPFGPILGGVAGAAIALGKGLWNLNDTFNEVDKQIKLKELETQSEKTATSISQFGKTLSVQDRTAAGTDFLNLAKTEAEAYNLKISTGEITSSSKPSEIMKSQESGAVAASKFLESEMKRTGNTFEELQASMDADLFSNLSQQIAEGTIEYANAVINRAKAIEQAQGDPDKIQKAEEDYKKSINDITTNSIKLLGISNESVNRQQQVNKQIENTIQIYNRINSSLIRFNNDIDNMRDAALQTAKDLDGSATISKSQRTGENVLSNISGYSSSEVGNVANLVSKIVGGEVGQNLSENVKASKFVIDKLPGILSATAQGENDDIMTAINKQAGIDKVKLPEFLLKDLADTLDSAIGGDGEGKKSIKELAQDPELLSKISKVLEASSETASKALKTYYDSLDKVIELQNEYVKTISISQEYQRKAGEIALNSSLDLKKVRGQEISLNEMNQPFETNIRSLTNGTTDPTQIANIIKSSQEEVTRLENQRIDPANIADIEKNAKALTDNRLRLNNATSALKQLADNSSRASNALNKIQEKAARNNATVGTIENVLTAGPEELFKIAQELSAVSQVMAGGAGPQGFKGRQLTAGGLNLIKDIIPEEEYRKLRGQFIKGSLSSMGFNENDKFFKSIDEYIKGVSEDDPIIKEYRRLIGEQQESNIKLSELYNNAAENLLVTSGAIFTKLSNELPIIIKNAYDLAQQEIQASLKAAAPPVQQKPVEQAPALPKVEIPVMEQPVSQIRTWRPPNTAMGAPMGRQNGGIVYASNGQLINFQPKGTDTVPAMLTPGEFVVNAKATKQNLGLLHSINNGSKGYSKGGVVYLADGGIPAREAWHSAMPGTKKIDQMNRERARKGLAPLSQQDLADQKDFEQKMAKSSRMVEPTLMKGERVDDFNKRHADWVAKTTNKQNNTNNNVDPIKDRRNKEDELIKKIKDPQARQLMQEAVNKNRGLRPSKADPEKLIKFGPAIDSPSNFESNWKRYVDARGVPVKNNEGVYSSPAGTAYGPDRLPVFSGTMGNDRMNEEFDKKLDKIRMEEQGRPTNPFAGIAYWMDVFETLGAASRNKLVGKNSNDAFDLTTKGMDSKRTSGRDLLRHYNMISDKDTWLNYFGGEGVEIFTDPTSLIGGKLITTGIKSMVKTGVKSTVKAAVKPAAAAAVKPAAAAAVKPAAAAAVKPAADTAEKTIKPALRATQVAEFEKLVQKQLSTDLISKKEAAAALARGPVKWPKEAVRTIVERAAKKEKRILSATEIRKKIVDITEDMGPISPKEMKEFEAIYRKTVNKKVNDRVVIDSDTKSNGGLVYLQDGGQPSKKSEPYLKDRFSSKPDWNKLSDQDKHKILLDAREKNPNFKIPKNNSDEYFFGIASKTQFEKGSVYSKAEERTKERAESYTKWSTKRGNFDQSVLNSEKREANDEVVAEALGMGIGEYKLKMAIGDKPFPARPDRTPDGGSASLADYVSGWYANSGGIDKAISKSQETQNINDKNNSLDRDIWPSILPEAINRKFRVINDSPKIKGATQALFTYDDMSAHFGLSFTPSIADHELTHGATYGPSRYDAGFDPNKQWDPIVNGKRAHELPPDRDTRFSENKARYSLEAAEVDARIADVKRRYAFYTGKLVTNPEEAKKAWEWWKENQKTLDPQQHTESPIIDHHDIKIYDSLDKKYRDQIFNRMPELVKTDKALKSVNMQNGGVVYAQEGRIMPNMDLAQLKDKRENRMFMIAEEIAEQYRRKPTSTGPSIGAAPKQSYASRAAEEAYNFRQSQEVPTMFGTRKETDSERLLRIADSSHPDTNPGLTAGFYPNLKAFMDIIGNIGEAKIAGNLGKNKPKTSASVPRNKSAGATKTIGKMSPAGEPLSELGYGLLSSGDEISEIIAAAKTNFTTGKPATLTDETTLTELFSNNPNIKEELVRLQKNGVIKATRRPGSGSVVIGKPENVDSLNDIYSQTGQKDHNLIGKLLGYSDDSRIVFDMLRSQELRDKVIGPESEGSGQWVQDQINSGRTMLDIRRQLETEMVPKKKELRDGSGIGIKPPPLPPEPPKFKSKSNLEGDVRYRRVFNAMTDSIKSLSEPPEGYSRLFRVGEIRTNMADFLARTEQRSREIDKKAKQLKGVVNTSPFDAQGRWFTDDSNELDYYIKRYYSENFDVPNLPLPKIYYVDIPNKKLSDINVKNTKFRNSSLNPDKEFVVPDEFLSASKEVPLEFRNKGGMIYASKGTLVNYQPRGTDTVPAMLTPGEFVVNAKATKQNLGLLHSINNGSQQYSSGGVVYAANGTMVTSLKPDKDIDRLTQFLSGKSLLEAATNELDAPGASDINDKIKISNAARIGMFTTGRSNLAEMSGFSAEDEDTTSYELLTRLDKIRNQIKDSAIDSFLLNNHADSIGPLYPASLDEKIITQFVTEALNSSSYSDQEKSMVFDNSTGKIHTKVLEAWSQQMFARQQALSKIYEQKIADLIKKEAINKPDDIMSHYTPSITGRDYVIDRMKSESDQQNITSMEDASELQWELSERQRLETVRRLATGEFDDGEKGSRSIVIAANSSEAAIYTQEQARQKVNEIETERGLKPTDWKRKDELAEKRKKYLERKKAGTVNNTPQTQYHSMLRERKQAHESEMQSRRDRYQQSPGARKQKTPAPLTKEEKQLKRERIQSLNRSMANAELPKDREARKQALINRYGKEKRVDYPRAVEAENRLSERDLALLREARDEAERDTELNGLLPKPVSLRKGGLVYLQDGGQTPKQRSLGDILSDGDPKPPSLNEIVNKNKRTLDDDITTKPEISTKNDPIKDLVKIQKQKDSIADKQKLDRLADTVNRSMGKSIKITPENMAQIVKEYVDHLYDKRNLTELDRTRKLFPQVEAEYQRRQKADLGVSAQFKSVGGLIYASKGQLIPYQPKGTDTVPAMLTPGEFVVNKNATSNNLPLLQSLNKGGSVRHYQYGGEVDVGNTGASKGGSGPINGYNLTIDSDTQNALSLFNKDFNSYVDKLVNFSFPTIPDKIEMVGNHTVDVRVTGAAAFESLQEGIKKLIDTSVSEKMGQVWNQTGGQVGKAPSLPSKK